MSIITVRSTPGSTTVPYWTVQTTAPQPRSMGAHLHQRLHPQQHHTSHQHQHNQPDTSSTFYYPVQRVCSASSPFRHQVPFDSSLWPPHARTPLPLSLPQTIPSYDTVSPACRVDIHGSLCDSHSKALPDCVGNPISRPRPRPRSRSIRSDRLFHLQYSCEHFRSAEPVCKSHHTKNFVTGISKLNTRCCGGPSSIVYYTPPSAADWGR